jgi:DNA-binding transcriptional regulator YiaG
MKPIPAEVQAARKAAKMTQAAAAALVSVAPRTWRSWEDAGAHGRRMPISAWCLFKIRVIASS